jgi:hypothetical protein
MKKYIYIFSNDFFYLNSIFEVYYYYFLFKKKKKKKKKMEDNY